MSRTEKFAKSIQSSSATQQTKETALSFLIATHHAKEIRGSLLKTKEGESHLKFVIGGNKNGADILVHEDVLELRFFGDAKKRYGGFYSEIFRIKKEDMKDLTAFLHTEKIL